MTKAQVLQRLSEIGDRFVKAGIKGDHAAFRERGIALGVAVDVIACLPIETLAKMLAIMEHDADDYRPRQ